MRYRYLLAVAALALTLTACEAVDDTTTSGSESSSSSTPGEARFYRDMEAHGFDGISRADQLEAGYILCDLLDISDDIEVVAAALVEFDSDVEDFAVYYGNVARAAARNLCTEHAVAVNSW